MIRIYLGIAVVISAIFAYLTALSLLDMSKEKQIKIANLRNLMIMALIPIAMRGFSINQNVIYKNITTFWVAFVVFFSFLVLITNFIELLAEWIKQKVKYLLLLFDIGIMISLSIMIYGCLINRIWIYEHITQSWRFLVLVFLGTEAIYRLAKAVNIIKTLNKDLVCFMSAILAVTISTEVFLFYGENIFHIFLFSIIMLLSFSILVHTDFQELKKSVCE